jgi:formylglycine-generating enzyme required for sulfatase activity
MGSPKEEPGRDEDEGPQREVRIESAFELGKYEVTQRQWRVVMGDNPSRFQDCGPDCPVENVGWLDVRKFLKRLNARNDGYQYRLPTEAEWEYACRAGSRTAIYSGPLRILGPNNGPELDPIAWYGGNSGVSYQGGHDSSSWPEKQYEHSTAGPHPVGRKQPNEWGLYDMIGNVWEWCADEYGPYPGGPESARPRPPASGGWLYRGGSWYSTADYCRSATRVRGSFGDFNLGFRLARIPNCEGSAALGRN